MKSISNTIFVLDDGTTITVSKTGLSVATKTEPLFVSFEQLPKLIQLLQSDSNETHASVQIPRQAESAFVSSFRAAETKRLQVREQGSRINAGIAGAARVEPEPIKEDKKSDI